MGHAKAFFFKDTLKGNTIGIEGPCLSPIPFCISSSTRQRWCAWTSLLTIPWQAGTSLWLGGVDPKVV